MTKPTANDLIFAISHAGDKPRASKRAVKAAFDAWWYEKRIDPEHYNAFRRAFFAAYGHTESKPA